ncbi:MAG: DNA polymerase II large subunit [Candidatus Hadarchaeales archaeon]
MSGGNMLEYFRSMNEQIDGIYEIAIKARAKGIDPELEPEIPRAGDLASRVEQLVGPKGVAEVIRDMEKIMGREEMALKIAEMIIDGRFGRLDEEKAAEQALRTVLAILTEGVVIAPLEGITGVRIRKNYDNTRYLSISFASPIRAAGGTAAALSVLAGDFVRRKLFLSHYKPTVEEVERFVEEVEIYGLVAHEQYKPHADHIRLAIQNIPVEITGEPTERDVTVTAFRNIERIGHNMVRGGAVLALTEGVLQKASKIMKYVEKLGIDGWAWLSNVVPKTTPEESETIFPKGDRYLGEVIAGRPILSHPGTEGQMGRRGGFRLRYGHSRNTGIAAIGIHPATMIICDDFIAVGTQLKVERPGKGGAVTPVDSIEGPVVKLKDGSVLQVYSEEEALKVRDSVAEILCLGDILVGYGEFLENNHPLMPAGYCEEWWSQEVKKALSGKERRDLEKYIEKPYPRPSSDLAVRISEELGVPLHPAYTYPYHDLEIEDLVSLARWLVKGRPEFDGGVLRKLRIQIEEVPKRILEELCVPHGVDGKDVVIEEHAYALCRSLGLVFGDSLVIERFEGVMRSSSTKDIMEIVQELAGFPIRKKAPTRIGARMGRPEKAKEREMSPPVHALFPVGFKGGSTRSIARAAESDDLEVELANMVCPSCGWSGFTRKCQKCGSKAEPVRVCQKCMAPVDEDRCPICNSRAEFFIKRRIKLKAMLESALKRLDEYPELVKGVQGMTSDWKIPEPLEKGILRAKHGVQVFKDGTVRFDETNVPLTHFKPKEIGVSVEKLRDLGYTVDFNGNPLEAEDQVVELKVQDIVISRACAEYLFKASRFIDELLEKVYGLAPYYNAKRPEDLLGHIVLGLAPHTSVGIAGRIIGFVDASVGYAHPFFHAAKRRDADGDEDCVMLLLDALLNFSRRFLPSKRGGLMDAPLILSTRINPAEIDKQAHNMDIMNFYPLEFYEATLRYARPQEVFAQMKTAGKKIGTEDEYTGFGYTHETNDISAGPKSTRYIKLTTMEEKISAQLSLARKIRAVDERDVAERLIKHHFIPDLKGNLRTFATQKFRCTSCNNSHRRIPLSGKCTRCGGKLVLTVTRGGVEKYLRVAMDVADDYHVSEYTKQRLKMTKKDIESMFESDASRQLSLADFL